jgi:hypothetical protein
MRNGKLPTGKTQFFYFHSDHPIMPGWFKGMKVIIRERACGQWMGCLHDVQISIALLGKRIAAADGFSLCSPTSRIKSPSCKNLSNAAVTYVTFTPNIIVSSTLLSNIGELRSFVFGWQRVGATTIEEMEQKVVACLNDVPLIQIRQ